MGNSLFSKTLQTLRKERGYTQEQLAEQLGVSAQAVSKWENGSYPDGDLIPKIAEIFDVSVSTLYGDTNEQTGIEQKVLDVMQKAAVDGNAAEKTMNILWATQLSSWADNHSYFPRVQSWNSTDLASVFLGEDFCSFINLDPKQEFVAALWEPDSGFSIAQDADQLTALFRILGEPGCIKVLLFLMSLRDQEFVNIKTIAGQAGLSEQQTRTILDHLVNGSVCLNCIRSADLLNSDGRREQVYGIHSETAVLMLSVLLQMQTLLSRKISWSFNNSTRERGLLNRKTSERSEK